MNYLYIGIDEKCFDNMKFLWNDDLAEHTFSDLITGMIFIRSLTGAPPTELLLPIQVTVVPPSQRLKQINKISKPTLCLRVKWRAGKGRCLVASRDINPLELIMFDAAIVTGPQVIVL